MNNTPTIPSPSDQAIPVRRPVSLAQLALSCQSIDPEHVDAYARSHSAFLAARYRYATTDIGLVQVSA